MTLMTSGLSSDAESKHTLNKHRSTTALLVFLNQRTVDGRGTAGVYQLVLTETYLLHSSLKWNLNYGALFRDSVRL